MGKMKIMDEKEKELADDTQISNLRDRVDLVVESVELLRSLLSNQGDPTLRECWGHVLL
jgi:hypothetical protein